jgi:hypothetical protein
MKGKIFTAQEVQSMIAGNKTQFREVVKPQPFDKCRFVFDKETNLITQIAEYSTENHKVCVEIDNSHSVYLKCPYQVGQEIFCKEQFLQTLDSTQLPSGEYETYFTNQKIEYVSDGAEERHLYPDSYFTPYMKKRPAQHMKQEHSRITLQIKEIKVERLQDISEEDCLREGCFFTQDDMGSPIFGFCKEEVDQELGYRKAQHAFKIYWNATHKKPEEKFEASPWVFVYQFEIIK